MWGIASSILTWVLLQPSLRWTESTPHFFVINPAIWELNGDNKTKQYMENCPDKESGIVKEIADTYLSSSPEERQTIIKALTGIAAFTALLQFLRSL